MPRRARRDPPVKPPPHGSVVRIRRGTLADLPFLVRHRRRMWEDIGGRTRKELDQGDPPFRRWARRELRSGRLVAFVAEAPDGFLVGCGCVWLQEQQPRPRWPGVWRLPYLMTMFTEVDYRRKGVATRLVEAAVAWSRQRGFPRIILHASTMGRPVYERLGFAPGTEMRLELPARPSRRAHRS